MYVIAQQLTMPTVCAVYAHRTYGGSTFSTETSNKPVGIEWCFSIKYATCMLAKKPNEQLFYSDDGEGVCRATSLTHCK